MEATNGKYNIPVWCKMTLSIEEAMAYSGIGKTKLYELSSKEECPFVLYIGSKRLIKREAFENYIAEAYSI